MLMKDDKKKSVAMILGKLGDPQEAPKSENGDEQDDSLGLKSAAEEILKAVESKNVDGLIEALKSFYEMCENEPEEDNEPEQP